MLGKPKFKLNDKVSFTLQEETIEGVIYIVDAYGTFDNPNEVSYDVLSEAKNILYKHIPERLVKEKID